MPRASWTKDARSITCLWLAVVVICAISTYPLPCIAATGKLWYLADVSVKTPAGVQQMGSGELLARASEVLGPDSLGVVIERRAFDAYGGPQVQKLRSAVLELRKIVWLTGAEVSLELLTGKLDIQRGIRRGGKTDMKVVADGLYLEKDGVVAGVTVMTTVSLAPDEALAEIMRATEAIAQRQRAATTKEKWKRRGKQTDLVRDKWGRFDKVNEMWLLVNHQEPLDYWYVKIENSSTPDIGFSSVLNDDENIVMSSQTLLCYGPERDVSRNSTARVKIGCPGPPEEWSWETGATMVKDATSKRTKTAAWAVEFDASGEESQTTHTWVPGLEADNPKGKDFVLDVRSVVRYRDRKGSTSQSSRTFPSFIASP